MLRAVRLAAASWLLLLLAPGLAWAQALKMDFLDVGQGDATLLTSPTGKTVLIDGGPPEMSTRLSVRLAALQNKIDLVILTHRHSDHMGGLTKIVDGPPGVRQFLDSLYPHQTEIYEDLVEALTRNGVTVRNAGQRVIDLGGGATMTLLAPPSPALRNTRSDVNANSVVARVDFGTVSVLFCGDAEAETEGWLLDSAKRLKANALKANVVKVPHHGSRHSSTPAFVQEVRPEVAIISVGKTNSYGHPHPDAIDRWKSVGARVYRTDVEGEIHLTSDGRTVSITSTTSSSAPAIVSGPMTTSFVASRRSKVFHQPDCPSAHKIRAQNRVLFSTPEEAHASQRDPARDCGRPTTPDRSGESR